MSPAAVGKHPDSVHVSGVHKKLEHHRNLECYTEDPIALSLQTWYGSVHPIRMLSS
jgi:hypothetical protein